MFGYPSATARRFFALVASLVLCLTLFPIAPALAVSNDLTINDVAVTEGNAGTANLTFTVTLTPAAGATPVTVNWATSDGTATAPSDYAAISGSLTFNTGESTKPVAVVVNGDTDFESAETLNLTLSGMVGATASDPLGIGTILNNDTQPTINAGSLSASEGAGTIVFPVTLTNASYQTITVAYATADGGAGAPGDYTAASGTLTFAAGVTTQSVAVPLINDSLAEGPETFFLNLSGAVNGTLGTNGTGTITDNDLPVITIDSPSWSEGPTWWAPSFDFQVCLDQAPAAAFPLTVQYFTSDGTALQPGDYTAQTNLLTFTSGGLLCQTVTVPVANDLVAEPDETFTVTLINPVNGTIGTPVGTGTILDDDVEPVIFIDSPTVIESGGSVDFTVTLEDGLGNPYPYFRTVTVDYASVVGSAGDPSEFLGTAGTLTFTPGDTSETITVVIVDDLIDEADESFTMKLSNPVYATIDGAANPGKATITDDDSPMISVSDPSRAENNTPITFVVTLDQPAVCQVTVDYATADGTALAGTDYTAKTGTVTFNIGQVSRNVTVVLAAENIYEADETLYLDLSNAQSLCGSGIGILDAQGMGTITNDDAVPLVSFGANVTASEAAVALSFNVNLDHPSAFDITVDYATADGTALAGLDYLAGLGTLTIPAGSTTVPLPVVPIDDLIDEPNQVFTITLSNPTGATLGAPITRNGTITDNDALSVINGDSPSAVESSATFDFTISLDRPSDYTVTVQYAFAVGGICPAPAAMPGVGGDVDYTGAPGWALATFAPGATSQVVSFASLDDTVEEPDEFFCLALQTPTNATILGNGFPAVTNGTFTILDDDVRMVINNVTVDEAAGIAQFTVSLTGGPSPLPVTVDWATQDQTATTPEDYTAASGSLAFAPGDLTKTIDVAIIDDNIDEASQTFRINLTNCVTCAPNPGNDFLGVGTITDNDLTPSLLITDVSDQEANTPFTFVVSLSHPSDFTITVNYATADGTALQPGDYTAAGALLTFVPRDMSEDVAITIINNTAAENDEDFFVNLSGGGLYDAGTSDLQGVGLILDDDWPVLSINSPTVGEGGVLTFTARLDGDPATGGFQGVPYAVTVDYFTYEIDALDPEDYTGAAGTLTFAAMDTTESFGVATIDEDIYEIAETMGVELVNAPLATLPAGPGIGTITSADPMPSVLITNVGDLEANGPFDFTVTLSNRSAFPVTIDFQTEDISALQPADYGLLTGTVTFAPLDTSETISVAIVDENIYETNETFRVRLLNGTGGGYNPTGSDFVGIGTIQNDDPIPTITISDQAILEGTGPFGPTGTVIMNFVVTASNPSEVGIVFTYQTNPGTATPPLDYTFSMGGSGSWDGVFPYGISVVIGDGRWSEPDEFFYMDLTPVSGIAAMGNDLQGVGTILNDDITTVSIDDITVIEGDSGTSSAIFTVTLSTWSTIPLYVDYAIGAGGSDPGTPGVDYNSLVIGTLLFPAVPGSFSLTQQIVVPIYGDTIDEADETYVINLTANALNPGLGFTDPQGLGTILDDDADLVDPIVTVPADMTLEATSPAGAVADYVPDPSAIDPPHADPAVTCDWPDGSTFPLGTTLVTCTATDLAGNVGTATFNVTVQDTTDPALTIPANQTLEATGPAGAVATFLATATDIVDPAPVVACLPPSGSMFPLGTTTVNCTATDFTGNVASGSFTITVQDTTDPILTVPANMTVEATSGGGAIVSYIATATDIVDTSVTVVCTPASGSMFPLGINTVACVATDNFGNTDSETFTITVVDTTPPVITLLGSNPVVIPFGTAFIDDGATASDLVDGDLTTSIVVVNPVNVNVAGIYTITYDVTDSHGNAAIQVTRTVEVAYFCGGLAATITGTDGVDVINGTPGADVIAALDGGDTIYGLGGADMICGGPGSDVIYGGEDADTIYANAGADYLYGEGGDDMLYGGAGNDKFIGGAGDDFMAGGSGLDLLDYSGAGAMTVDLYAQTAAGDGNDSVISFERLIGSAFDDTLIGGPADNTIWGGAGSDLIYGGGGNDSLYGEAGDDTIYGQGGDDSLYGGPGEDTLIGGQGNDIIDLVPEVFPL